MLYRIVISHNQSEYLSRFSVGDPDSVIAVFDARTDIDVRCCAFFGYHMVTAPCAGNRGANRNAGLSFVWEQMRPRPDDIVEFLDGDRFPLLYNMQRARSLMRKHGLDVLLYTCMNDARLRSAPVPPCGTVLVDTGTLCNPFYSCGFAMKASAIGKVLEFNNGHLFEPRFTKWGCEDQYLGLTCAKLGLRVAITTEVILNGGVGGDSDFHPDYRESLQQYVDLIREKNLEIRNMPRPCERLE